MSDGFELGPIRPPSEAMSLLVRVSRNCPWNRCAFCPVYKGAKYSKRSVAEVHADLDALRRLHGDTPRTVFLQDADPLLTRPDDLVEIVEGVRERFPKVRRITTYARSRTLARRTLEELTALREAGLDRVHVGLESGSDRVLALVKKGATREDHIEAGRKALAAGFELSEYVMPGLGGRALTDEHADETASAIAAIEPDFVRLRTTAVAPGSPLAEMEESGDWEPLTEVETVAEIRRFFAGLDGVTTRIESDHSLNLLMELRGDLPDDHEDLLALLDHFLALPDSEQTLFILGRRMGHMLRLAHLERPPIRDELNRMKEEIEARGYDAES
ncbi:MAG: radical SAM protein, partial [Planctomycetota bacterium]